MACRRFHGALRGRGIAVRTDRSTGRDGPGMVGHHAIRVDRSLRGRLRHRRRGRRNVRDGRLSRCRLGRGLSQGSSCRQRKNRSRSQCNSAHLVFSIELRVSGDRPPINPTKNGCDDDWFRRSLESTIDESSKIPHSGPAGNFAATVRVLCMALINQPFTLTCPAPTDCPVTNRIGGTLNILHAFAAALS